MDFGRQAGGEGRIGTKGTDVIRDVTWTREKLMLHNEPVGGNQTCGAPESERERKERVCVRIVFLGR